MYKYRTKVGTKEFNQWYLKFLQRYGGLVIDPKEWPAKCLEAHKTLVDYLGSHTVSHKVKTQPYLGSMTLSDEDQFLYVLKRHIDRFSIRQQVIDIVFHNNKYCLDDYKRKVRVTKRVADVLRKNNSCDKESISSIIKAISYIHDKYLVESEELRYVLTTNPKHFVELGHMLRGRRTCYRQCGQRSESKYNLALKKDSFVVMVYRKRARIGRFWGYATDKYRTFITSNGYYGQGVRASSINSGLITFMSKILREDEDKIKIYKNKTIEGYGAFFNNNSATVFTKYRNRKYPERLNLPSANFVSGGIFTNQTRELFKDCV